MSKQNPRRDGVSDSITKTKGVEMGGQMEVNLQEVKKEGKLVTFLRCPFQITEQTIPMTGKSESARQDRRKSIVLKEQ